MTNEEKARKINPYGQITILNAIIADYEKENAELKKQIESYLLAANESVEIIADLKKQISVLLSCSNCTENKGGYICEKEYNDKCLAQKIEYIKELEKENEQLKCDLYNTNANLQHITIEYERENAELKAEIGKMKSFVKSMYEANKNDAYCKEYLGTILNEWELEE